MVGIKGRVSMKRGWKSEALLKNFKPFVYRYGQFSSSKLHYNFKIKSKFVLVFKFVENDSFKIFHTIVKIWAWVSPIWLFKMKLYRFFNKRALEFVSKQRLSTQFCWDRTVLLVRTSEGKGNATQRRNVNNKVSVSLPGSASLKKVKAVKDKIENSENLVL